MRIIMNSRDIISTIPADVFRKITAHFVGNYIPMSRLARTSKVLHHLVEFETEAGNTARRANEIQSEWMIKSYEQLKMIADWASNKFTTFVTKWIIPPMVPVVTYMLIMNTYKLVDPMYTHANQTNYTPHSASDFNE